MPIILLFGTVRADARGSRELASGLEEACCLALSLFLRKEEGDFRQENLDGKRLGHKIICPATRAVSSALGWAENMMMGSAFVSAFPLRFFTSSRPSLPESRTSSRINWGSALEDRCSRASAFCEVTTV